MGKLLIIADRFPPDLGGVARSASRTANVLKDMGVEVDVFAWTRAVPPGELVTEQLGEAEIAVHRVGLFSNLDFSMQHSQNVIEWLHEQRSYDAIWGHYLYPAGYLAVMQARLLGIKSTVSARGNDIDRIMFPPGDFARLNWTLEQADLLSCVSRDLARKINVLLGRNAKATVIGNSVDLDTFQPGEADEGLKGALKLPAGDLILGFCGELRQKKGFPFLLRALCDINEARPATLLVIGEVRPREQETLTEFAIDHPEEARRIIATGVIDEPEQVAKHLQLCDVVLQPSVWDGLPNALLEAMACGKLVIGSDAGGIPDVIEAGRSGLMIPRAELPRLGEAVLELFEQPAEVREAMREAARQRVEEHFHRRREADLLRPIMKELGCL